MKISSRLGLGKMMNFLVWGIVTYIVKKMNFKSWFLGNTLSIGKWGYIFLKKRQLGLLTHFGKIRKEFGGRTRIILIIADTVYE
jgi:hypothetical protein